MSKTLNIAALKSFKPTGINVDQSLITSALQEIALEEDSLNQEDDPSSGKDIVPTEELANHSTAEFNSLKSQYEEEIKRLQRENKQLKKGAQKTDDFVQIKSRRLKENLRKFVKAIETEARIQKTDWPILSTNKLRRVYKVTADSFKECLAYGISEKIFKRKEKAYSGSVVTWAYKLLKGLS
jgi:predicted RNase H-like nuclease (RuvC/YqgF family)